MSQAERKAIVYSSPGRSVYVGRVEQHFTRFSAVSTLIVSLDGEMKLIGGEGQQSALSSSKRDCWSKSFLVPAGSTISLDTQGSRVALSFLDDLSGDVARLGRCMREEVCLDQGVHLLKDLKDEAVIIRDAEAILRERPAASEVMQQCEHWLGYMGQPHLTDDRVLRAAAILRARYAENVSVGEIAAQVNLSVPRLIQLFKAVIGTPIRRYRLWWRILATAEKVNQGMSLTEASVASGFCDYAQFSRVYRELCGGSPAAAKTNTEIRIFSAQSPHLSLV